MAKKLQITKDMMDKLHKGEEVSIDDITITFPVNEEKIEIDDKTKFVIDLKHLLDKHVVKEGSCGYGEDGKLGDKPAGPDLIRKAIRKEIKSLNEDNSNKGYQEARKLIDQLRAKTYRSFSDEELDAFSKEMALHFIDNQAAEAAIMMRSAKMKGDDYKPGTTDELPFE